MAIIDDERPSDNESLCDGSGTQSDVVDKPFGVPNTLLAYT